MQKEYTIEDIKANPEKAGEMLKHNKKLKGWVDPDEKKEWVDEGVTLRERFGEPPFSILDGKTKSWQDRKKKWLDLGIKSEEGRTAECLIGKNTGENDYMPDMKSGTSIFDPGLCELMYKWFCPEGGDILDPFAGGSVRGIVAHKLGYNYTGIELRPEQVEANIKQGKELCPGNEPNWICGDSNKVLDTLQGKEYEMIFSCPPYANLEVYSELDGDLSNMTYSEFLEGYRSIIKKAFTLLASGGFAVFVVGDVRDERGYYLDFISDTIKAFIDPFNAGGKLYNNMILLDPIGTAMIRARKFESSKKVVKIHQNILVFKKM